MGMRIVAILMGALLMVVPLGVATAEGALLPDMEAAEIASTIDAFVLEHESTTAAVSIGVSRSGRVLFERAYGFADIGAQRAADADTVYEWGSATKLLVWTSVMQLVEQGKIDLRADIKAYLPDGFLTRLTYDQPITMLNLMHHNAGWGDVLVGLFVQPSLATQSLEQALQESEPSQIYRPGAVCAYSNWGTALAGLIVERVGGEPTFSGYVHKHIFDPLGMDRTALLPSLSDNEWVQQNRPLTQGYAGSERIENLLSVPLYPAGMGTGTMSDFLRFASALTPEDGRTTPLFSNSDTLSQLLTPSLLYGNGAARNAHGFWSFSFASPVVGHAGNTAAFSAYLMIQPESHTALTIMTNQANEGVYNSELPKQLFGKPQFESGSVMPDAREMRGVYRSSRVAAHGVAKIYGVMMTIPLFGGDENALTSAIPNPPLMAMDQSAPDVFTINERSAIQLVDTMYAERTADGGAQLTMPYFSFIRIPTGQAVWELCAIMLMALALVYFAVALVIGFARWLIMKLGQRKPAHSPLRKWHMSLCALGLIESVNIVWMAINLLTYQSKLRIGANIIITCIYAAAVAGYLIAFLIRARKLDSSGREKALSIWTAALSLVMVLNIAMWEWYRF